MGTASVYLRRSKVPGERSVSLASQEKEVRDLCARLGHEVISVHSDTVSGALLTRPGFLAWLADAGQVDLLAAWAVDRTTRSGLLGAAKIVEAIDGTTTRVVTVDGLDSEAPGFGMRLAMGAEIAKEERARTIARSKATRKALLDAEKWPSGQAPFGTRFDCPDLPGCVGDKDAPKHHCTRHLEPDPVEGEVLRDVAQRMLRGESMRQVLLWMNDQGLTTRRGNPWTRSSLTTTLESATSREHIFTLAESRALAERLHPKPGMRPTGGRPAVWLLSGWATCAGCGRPMTTSRDAQRDVTRYVCPTTTSVAPCPARATIRADRVNEYVEKEYLRLWGGRIQPKVVTVMEADVEIDEAERALEEARAAMEADDSDENVDAWRSARRALESAMAKPVKRNTKTIGHDRLRDLWAQADTPGRVALLKRATGAGGISITRATGSTWDESRIRIDWRD